MKPHKSASTPGYRDFVFTATGRDIDPKRLTGVDLYDNMVVELDRLHALADLLSLVNDEVDAQVASGLALLLKDVERRSRCILEAFDRCRSRTRDKP